MLQNGAPSIRDIFIGSGAAIALLTAIYAWVVKGRVHIGRGFLRVHEDQRKARYRVRVRNRGFRTLNDLQCHITVPGLRAEELCAGEESKLCLLNRDNFIPVEDELLIWDTGERTCTLHPFQCVDVDLLHFHRHDATVEFPSEQGYGVREVDGSIRSRARARLPIVHTHHLNLRFFGENYRSRLYRFLLQPRQEGTGIHISKCH